MKLGIGSYTYGWAFSEAAAGAGRGMDLPELIRRAGGLGVGVVQIADNAAPERLPEARLEALAEQAAEAGIELELGGRGLTRENLDRHLSVARHLGVSLLRFVIDGDAYRPPVGEVVTLLRQAVPRLRD
ncbi:MAG: sugar phosphate isomerase/epimerase, partial [Lentisphaeria bacterium]|nr:sugar phosphate isomerase/epimerase [Lentisphaeria bacterium]